MGPTPMAEQARVAMCVRMRSALCLLSTAGARAAWMGLALVLWAGLPDGAVGQTLSFEGGPPVLRIDRFAPGRTTATATDASTALVYERAPQGGRERKVMVSAVRAPARFALSVEAVNPVPGTPTGPVPLRDGRAPATLLRNVPPCPQRQAERLCEGRLDLRYRLRADIGDRPGRATYTVRYTVLAQ